MKIGDRVRCKEDGREGVVQKLDTFEASGSNGFRDWITEDEYASVLWDTPRGFEADTSWLRTFDLEEIE